MVAGGTVIFNVPTAEDTGMGRMGPLALGSAVYLEVGMVIAITPTVHIKSDLLRKGNFPNPAGIIRQYTRNQEKEDARLEQLEMFGRE